MSVTARPRVPLRTRRATSYPSRSGILVVDDNVDAAISIGELLRLDGHEVCVVPSANAALDSFQTFRPEVVLLDIGLPDMNGYQVAQQIRSSAGAVRIVALTGYGHTEDLRRARDAGFDAHLVKPVDLDLLGKAIGRSELERVPPVQSPAGT